MRIKTKLFLTRDPGRVKYTHADAVEREKFE